MTQIAKKVGGRYDKEKSLITGLDRVGYDYVANRFKSAGFKVFKSYNSDHPGLNLMNQIADERWYHVTVEPGGAKTGPPKRITIHCDVHKPDTFEHLRKDYWGLPF